MSSPTSTRTPATASPPSPPPRPCSRLTSTSTTPIAEQVAQQQRIAEAAASQAHALEQLASVPEPVKRYLISLWSLLNAPTPNLAEIQAAYDSGWNRISDKFYSNKEWPEAEVIAPLVNYDDLFLTLYKELYFKHILARLQPTLEDRISSYENYCALANTILNSPGPVPITLPVDWLYNMSVLPFLPLRGSTRRTG